MSEGKKSFYINRRACMRQWYEFFPVRVDIQDCSCNVIVVVQLVCGWCSIIKEVGKYEDFRKISKFDQ